ncbi:MAG: hypothetical protein IJU45_06485, partial [Clostridia bacterium]|nr:hypothetical protein [Clostridia bacterium]
VLSQMLPPQEVLEILQAAQLDINDFYGMYGTQKINDALLYAKDLKTRFTVLWIYYDLFGK